MEIECIKKISGLFTQSYITHTYEVSLYACILHTEYRFMDSTIHIYIHVLINK